MSGININNILGKKEFNELSNNTKQEILDVSEEIKDKSSSEAMKIIGEFYKNTLSKEELTPAKKEELYKSITSSLDKKSKMQFDKLYDLLLKNK